jgi:hypothetical protein
VGEEDSCKSVSACIRKAHGNHFTTLGLNCGGTAARSSTDHDLAGVDAYRLLVALLNCMRIYMSYLKELFSPSKFRCLDRFVMR